MLPEEGAFAFDSEAQRLRNPLIKEYNLNLIRVLIIT